MESSKFSHELAAGTVGGIIGITAVYPLDTAKMRLQTYPHYNGLFDVIKSMVRKEGPASLYRGLLSPMAGFGVTFAISFAGYGQGIRFFKQGESRQSTLIEMTLAGCWAGLVQSPARQIFERVKSVMQVQKVGEKAPYRWSGECVYELVRREGLYNGLFRGMDATLAREIPQFAVYYPIYELLVRQLRERHHQSPSLLSSPSPPLPPHLLLLAGGLAGTFQWLPPFYCIDVIKSRMQSALPGVYKNAWDCALKSYRQEGLRVFFRGLSTALIRAFPLHAFIFLGYESTIVFLRDFDNAPQPPPPAG